MTLPQLISQLFQQTFFGKQVTTLFDQIEPLFEDYRRDNNVDGNNNFSINLLWARILFHIVSLAGDDASQTLLEKSLEASRVCLVFDSGKSEKQRHHLNFMIREVTARLFPGIRVVLSPDSSYRFMVASKDCYGQHNSTESTTTRTVICQEEPFAVWSGSSVQEGLDAINNKTSNNNDSDSLKRAKVDSLWCPDLYLSEAVSTFLSARKTKTSPQQQQESSNVRQQVKDVAALRANCHHYFEKKDQNKTHQQQQEKEEDQIAVFDVLSKISHSCSPNCFYDGSGSLVVGGNGGDSSSSVILHRGDALSFPYFHRKFLLRSTNIRRESLDQSHNFVCGCPRCMNIDPKQHGRTFLCKNQNCSSSSSSSGNNNNPNNHCYYCEVVDVPLITNTKKNNSSSSPIFIHSTMNPLVTENPSAPSSSIMKKWQCAHCGDVAAITTEILKRCQMVESRLEQSTMSNLSQLSLSSSSSSASASSPIPKNIFEKLKNDMMDCLQHLGRNHWLYLECCRTMIQFFLRVGLAPTSAQQTRLMCLEFGVRWTMKFISGCSRQGILHVSSSSSSSSSAPAAVASYAVEAAKALLAHCPNSQWRIHAALIIQLVLDVDAHFAKSQLLQSLSSSSSLKNDIIELASKSLQIFNSNNDHSWTSSSTTSATTMTTNNNNKPTTPLEALLRTADLVDSDDAGLITAWENHLADRVSALLQRSGGGSNNSTNSGDAAARLLRSQLNLPPQ